MALTRLEYENLMNALKLALETQNSTFNLYFTLSRYLNAIHDHSRGLDLGMTVLKKLETYPVEKLEGPLGLELIDVLHDIGNRQLDLKQYSVAEAFYQKELKLSLDIKRFDGDTGRRQIAAIYHQLGKASQKQRKWEQAEQYFQQTLQIDEENNDRHSQGSTYHQLGLVAQDQEKWEQAKQYFQKALQIYIEDNDYYFQAATYINLGGMALDQGEWKQAGAYLFQALEIFISYRDEYYTCIALYSLARLWQASGDETLPAAISSVIGGTPERVEVLLREVLERIVGETSNNQED